MRKAVDTFVRSAERRAPMLVVAFVVLAIAVSTLAADRDQATDGFLVLLFLLGSLTLAIGVVIIHIAWFRWGWLPATSSTDGPMLRTSKRLIRAFGMAVEFGLALLVVALLGFSLSRLAAFLV